MYENLLNRLNYLIENTEENDNSELILTILNAFFKKNETDPVIWKKMAAAVDEQLNFFRRRDRVINVERSFIDEDFRINYNKENDLKIMEKERRYMNDFPEQVRNYLSYRVYMNELGRPNQQIYEED